MEAYSDFAEVYDCFMDNVPYEKWAGWLVEEFTFWEIREGLVLDLACGTGKLTRQLAIQGYDMIGIDLSEEMLAIAEGEKETGDSILYLCQDMREFELYGTVHAIVSVCDSLNYILEWEELAAVFALVDNYLDPGGIFIFDMNTEFKYRNILGENSFCETRENCSFIWENYYEDSDKINQYDITMFVQEEGDKFRRFEETHLQKAYSQDEIRGALDKAGLRLEAVYNDYSREKITDESQRYVFVARKNGKEKSNE